ncbi:P-loop containing nucleoside triphosphate hydrolase [Arabidopsis suecica]|uniref:P-loop containing nucleoside triphosphate hydrolase n=1 Tax=Arabidopsis suecica TaxID=45249 RepID=A0A8T2B3K3_ARASU|nr:P-loop containing nucleoside triphosphate hydrolase [Arabidopsis suecica]
MAPDDNVLNARIMMGIRCAVSSYKRQRSHLRDLEGTVKQLIHDRIPDALESPQFVAEPADVYLLDEPSAELDSEERVEVARVIKSFIRRQPSCECTAHPLESVSSGINRFLKTLDMTFQKHPTCFRPQLNMVGSSKDLDQKPVGRYFVLDD